MCYVYHMKRKGDPLEKNLISTSLDVFLENYNACVPKGFPQADAEVLKQFRTAYPALFKKVDMWSIDRHRKRLMDWLSLQRRLS